MLNEEMELAENRLALSSLIMSLNSEKRLSQIAVVYLTKLELAKVSNVEKNDSLLSIDWMSRIGLAFRSNRNVVGREL